VTSLNWRFLFFYALGAYTALRYPQVLLNRPPRNMRILLGCSIPLWLILNAFFDSELFSIVMIVCLWYSFDEDTIPQNKALSVSFFVYVLHILLFSVIKKLQYALLPHSELYMLLSYVTVPIFALLVLIPLANVLKRRTPVAYRLLTGGR
jgi:hypothetical protein